MNLRERCCGCSACMNICPVSAIHMERDGEGFLYPVVDESKCIKCNLCERVCAFKKENAIIHHEFITEAYAVRNKSEDVIAESTSGGAFTAISDVILSQNGYVVGCVYSDDYYKVNYTIATCEQMRNHMRGSKYIQAEPQTVFREIKQLLERGETVLFTGTPCFAEGLLSYIPEKLRARLYTCAIVCHGSPSPMIWEEYLKEIESREKEKITNIRFRDKKEKKSMGEIANNQKIDIRPYLDLYYSNCITRPSCYTCKYATPERSVDLSIGDFWGIEKAVPDFGAENASVILVHSHKGKELLDKCRENLQIQKCLLEDALQENLKRPTSRPQKRDEIWKVFHCKGIKGLLKKYTSESLIVCFKKKIKAIMK